MPNPGRDAPKILIVEGKTDQFAVHNLMKFHVDLRDFQNVRVEVGNSADEILAKGYLSVQIKAAHVRTVGVILDADSHAAGRYQRVRQLLAALFPSLPKEMPKEGLIADNEDNKRLGLWIMPDNESEGGLETLLRNLIPNESEGLWKWACEALDSALALGAACRPSHHEKARLYTWLAWQDEPGQSPGTALTRKILDPRSDRAASFVNWFKALYAI